MGDASSDLAGGVAAAQATIAASPAAYGSQTRARVDMEDLL